MPLARRGWHFSLCYTSLAHLHLKVVHSLFFTITQHLKSTNRGGECRRGGACLGGGGRGDGRRGRDGINTGAAVIS